MVHLREQQKMTGEFNVSIVNITERKSKSIYCAAAGIRIRNPRCLMWDFYWSGILKASKMLTPFLYK
jgi:hypothetical protein